MIDQKKLALGALDNAKSIVQDITDCDCDIGFMCLRCEAVEDIKTAAKIIRREMK